MQQEVQNITHRLLFLSPNGTTRHVVQVASDTLREAGYAPILYDYALPQVRQDLAGQWGQWSEPTCLWVASPVYVDHALPCLMQLLEELPQDSLTAAVPLATYGGVCSGVALWEMGEVLQRKGAALLGGAKVMAEHSSMWRSGSPLGQGRPDRGDDQQVTALTQRVLSKLAAPQKQALSLDELDYQPPQVREASMAKSLELMKQNMPAMELDKERCSRCGTCAEACPVGAVFFDPYPVFAESCIRCLQCVRQCPDGAILGDPRALEQRIRQFAEQSPEPAETRIFG